MSTTVLLTVTPGEPIDPDRYAGEVPADIAAALAGVGQPANAGLVQKGGGPLRLRFQLSGPDRVAAGQHLVAQLTHLGFEADVSFSP